MKCTHCGAEIPEESKFCPECGTPVDEMDAFEEAPVKDNKPKLSIGFEVGGVLGAVLNARKRKKEREEREGK